MTTFHDAPNIRRLTLNGQWDEEFLREDLNKLWANLTDLTFTFPSDERGIIGCSIFCGTVKISEIAV